MKPQLIALHGPAGSGKTTAARTFCDWHHFTLVKFAGPLKQMFRGLLGSVGADLTYIEDCIDGKHKESPSHYLSGASPRQVMQGLGEWGRGVDPDFWVNPSIHRAMQQMERGFNVVIDDCRYPNEAEAILKVGGRVVQIVGKRPAVCTDEHPSEKPLPGHLITDTLDNTGSLTDLHHEVLRLIREH